MRSLTAALCGEITIMPRYFHLIAMLLAVHVGEVSKTQAQRPPTVTSLGKCRLAHGAAIEDCRVAYRTYGRLNATRNNVVLIPTWLLGRSEDWLPLLGQNAYVDTTRFYTIVVDAFGDGRSSSPSNTPPDTHVAFRELTIGDMVEAQHRLLVDHLGLSRLHAVVGISMGAMQAFEWAVRYPTFADIVIPIMGSPQIASYDRLLWTTSLSEVENGRALGATDDSLWIQVLRRHTLVLRTPRALNESDSTTLLTEVAKEAARFRQTWYLEDYAAQLHAILRHDVASGFGGDLSRAAAQVRARMLIIYSWDDLALSAGPAVAFAKYVRADTLSISSPCGHIAFECEQARIGAVVRDFLVQ
jgi:homoserine acetyltransferase